MYSFPWRKNSCAIDSVGSILQMIHKNLNAAGKAIMDQYCPDLCQLFTNLSNGSMPTHKAKESLEQLLGDRLWTNQTSFWKFRNHSYEDVDVALKLYRIHPPSSLSAVNNLPANENNVSLFTTSVTVADVCSTKDCNAQGVQNFQQEIID